MIFMAKDLKPKAEKKEANVETNQVKTVSPWKILQYPHLTEKSMNMVETENKLVFIVDRKYKKKEICFAEKNEDLIYSKIIKNAEKSIKIEKGVEFSPTDIQKISENAKEILTIEKRKSRK